MSQQTHTDKATGSVEIEGVFQGVQFFAPVATAKRSAGARRPRSIPKIASTTRRLAVVWALIAGPAAAQNLGGVFGPSVAADDSSGEVRLQVVPSDDGRPARYAARVHYQRSITDSVRVRGVVQGVDDGRNGYRLNGVQGELQWQVTPDGQPVQFGLRGDGRVGWNGLSDLVSLAATAEVPLANRANVRAVVLSQKILGSEAPAALQWQTRARVSYRLDGPTLAMEYYGFHGRLGRGGTDDQVQVGPMVTLPVGPFNVTTGPLLGLTDPTADVELRLWVGTRF